MWTIAAVSAAIAEIARFAPPPAAAEDATQQRRRQPQVAEDEPDEPAGERDQEAPEREEKARSTYAAGTDTASSRVRRCAK